MARVGVIKTLVSIEKFIQAYFPDATYKQVTPKQPEPGTFVIQLIESPRVDDTGDSTLMQRAVQIVYFDERPELVIDAMDELSYRAMDRNVIRIDGTNRFLRVGGFSFSQPVVTDNDLYAVLGVMQVELREKREEDNAPLIMEVHSTITITI